MPERRAGTREQWLSARTELLGLEKEYLRRGDELARKRLELPWVRIDTPYSFETEDGTKTLVELFAENVRRYTEGLPLLNLVDKKLGY